MALRQRKYPKEELARRGKELYENHVLPLVEAGNKGRFVAIDVDTGEYELGDETLETTHRLLDRLPDAQIWMERIGYREVHRIGGSSLRPT